VKLVIYAGKTKVVGAGIPLVLIACGRKILYVAHKGACMRVTVKLFATLARFSSAIPPGTPFEINLPESATVQDLVDQLGIPSEETKISFVNGLIRDLGWVLKQADEVGIFPPIGGG
jgi:molybdopterin converting factor small subunit